MSMIVLLNAGPLGMITNPKSSSHTEACKNWLAGLVYKGVQVVIPEIADYEVRRELLRAADFWANARRMGRQSADDASLDADMILVAQAGDLVRDGDETVIATTNIRHLVLFSSARIWRDIG